MGIDPSFWSGRRVFLTGHTGFKGSWLAVFLSEIGARVSGFALLPSTDPSLFAAAEIAGRVASRIGDVRDLDAVRAAMAADAPEVVFHFAAQSLVRKSYQSPIETYATNVLGTAHVLEAVREVGSVRTVIVATSDKCYDNQGWSWGYRETDPLGGHDPYSSSKACAELVTNAYARSFFSSGGVAVASVRAGNVIGGGDWAQDRLIPDIISAFRKGRSADIRSPHAVRPWQHVLDALGGYLLLAEKLWDDRACVGAWNFGPQDDGARPVRWIAEMLAQHWGGGAHWSANGGTHPHEAAVLRVDASRARQQLGWRCRIPLEEALARIVDWHRPPKLAKLQERMCLEIRDYLEMGS